MVGHQRSPYRPVLIPILAEFLELIPHLEGIQFYRTVKTSSKQEETNAHIWDGKMPLPNQ